MKKNKLSNIEFENALENPNNKAIMIKASSAFKKFISKEELESCKMVALWQSMQDWRLDGGQKFESYLYQKVKWECLRVCTQEFKYKKRNRELIHDIQTRKNENLLDLLEILDPSEQDLLTQRFLHNMTLKEIGTLHGYSYETARKKIKKILSKLKCAKN